MDRATMTEMFLRAQQEHPEIPEFQPMTHSMELIGAATETIAITLASIFYFLLQNLDCYEKLKAELSSLPASNTPVSFSTAQSLPYLNAVINESMRLHVAERFPRGREVPKGGITICNQFVPAGTTVSVYPDVSHRRKEVFGEDANVFRPERWLESEEKTNMMNASMLSFGVGKFVCLGKNLARLEVLKFVSSVLRVFDFAPVSDKEWKLVNEPFAHPIGFLVKVEEARS